MSLDRILVSIDHLLSNLDKSVNDLLWHAKLFIPILAISMALLVIVLIVISITQCFISRKKSERYMQLGYRGSEEKQHEVYISPPIPEKLQPHHEF